MSDPEEPESESARPEKRKAFAGLLVIVVITAVLATGAYLLLAREDPAVLDGRVVDLATKRPLKGAVIEVVHAPGRKVVKAGDDGRFRASVDASEPIAFKIDAPGHMGSAAFGKLCPGETREVTIELPEASPTQAPPAPVILPEGRGC